MVPVNYLAILVAALLSMVLGSLWYGPIFGKPWMKMMGMSKESMKGMKSGDMAKLYGIQFIGSLFMAFILAHALVFASSYLHESGISAGLQTGFWNWLGFIAPITLGSVLWEGKSWKLWLLNNGYYLTLLCMMGVLLALWV
ncbi:MAG TPA: DUF1761 domain-containing protein [Patescibacteria group bacterium]|nr:DUF1761 domain-containing protein [Patescibacteria group bacterium]